MKFNSTDINSGNCWQIGTGDDTRSYLDIFLNYGVALVGPGDPGREGDPKTIEFYKEHPKRHNWGAILKKIKKDQWVIARKGTRLILAIGKVIKEIDHSELFSDVEGWNLQHFVEVKWYIPKTINKKIELKKYVLGQSTISRCNKKEVYDSIYKNTFEEYPAKYKVKNKNISKSIDYSDIMNMLIDKGLRVQDAENISNTIKRIVRLTQWYRHNDKEVLEHEVVAFLIVPLLIALGWSEQKIKIEYQNIDIALFEKVFTGNYQISPHFILEAKTFGNGLAFTDNQIRNYAETFPNCKNFIATNGFIYKIFEKNKNGMVYKGYFNLLRLKEKNVIYHLPLTTIQSIFSISNLH